MSQPPPPPRPRDILAQAGLTPKKSWGQSFLLDQRILADIAAYTEASRGQHVLELGAGLGALTYHLLARGARVTAVERDRELAPVLRQVLGWAGERLEVLEADAVRLDYTELAVRVGGPLIVAGNLPYQLSSRILVSLAEARAQLSRAVLLVQREVAERLTAAPGSRTYGLLSVLVQRQLAAGLKRVVPPSAFLPRPKVHSAIVVLVPAALTRDALEDEALVAVARVAFQARRKTLRAAFSLAWRGASAALAQAFARAGVDPMARAESLSVDDFARLGAALVAAGLLGGGPRG
jgi:16S rRNA (adenine1518-N6/adenine1519-N6)-dimethyltransferase